jgi:hypothetical protein
MTTHLVIPDQHAHPDFHNKRADWLGQLIKELRPDVVINIGDAADMPSLSSYDKGTKGFQGRKSWRATMSGELSELLMLPQSWMALLVLMILTLGHTMMK